MKLRTGLFFLVAGAVVPVLALALVLGILLIDHERETFRRGALDRNRALFSAVEEAISGHITTLQALATSSNLETGNIVGFERRLGRILDSQPDWDDVILSYPDGRRMADAGHPDQRSTVQVQDPESLRRAVETGEPAIGNVVRRLPGGRFSIAIRYPVRRGREVVYVLSAMVRPEQFQRLLEAQQLPAGWASGVVDSTHHFIARVPPRPNADLASEDFRAHVAQAEEGWYRGTTVDGADTFTAFLRSARSGWSMGLGIPAEVVTASSRRVAWTLSAGALVASLLALAFAIVVGRRISEPMAALSAAARSLGEGKAYVPAAATLPIDELRDVQRALAESGSALAERHALREREQAALHEAERAKDEFIAVLGHELRNPLSAIASSVQLQRLVPEGSAAATGAREVIERQTKQMVRLVGDLMDISRLATGKLEIRRERVDLAALARVLVETWESSSRIQPGRVRLDLQPAWVDGDRARLEQVVANLLDNACKFSDPATTIVVRVAPEGQEAVLQVRDEGDGMTAEMMERIFKPFVQAPTATHRTTGGLGLGLSVVQRLVALHGGRVAVASEGSGKGATFTVRLPLAQPPDPAG